MFHFFPIQEAECIYWQGLAGLCTKNTSQALIERPYSCAPQAVGAVYDRPGFFVQSPAEGSDPKFFPDLYGHGAGAKCVGVGFADQFLNEFSPVPARADTTIHSDPGMRTRSSDPS